ncbi:MAG: efflux RND transporter periplasmic adaptor subunit [Usitatibacter sp.]
MQLRKKRYFKHALVVLAFVLAAGSLVGLRATQAKKEEPKRDDVVLEFTASDVATAELRELVRTISFSGSLAPVVQTTVKSKVSGEINRLFVREGESVARGQVLAQIETVDLQSRLDAQEGALEEARARLDIAQKNRENSRQLLRQNFISQNAFDTVHSTYEANAASMRSAEAQLRIARKAMDDAAVRAPFTGIVARKMVNAGEKVGIDSPLFALVDLANMEIEAPAPAAEIPSVKPGQAASFRVDGFTGRVFAGRLERINPTADAGSRSIMLYISVQNHDGALRGGMFAKGEIVLDKREPSTVIPASAVRDEAGQSYVFTIEDGKVAKRAVKLGATDPQGGLVEVRSGLEKGIQVVSARVSGLKAGAPAVIKPSPAVKPA